MNPQLQETIKVIDDFDRIAVAFVANLTQRLELLDEPLDPRNMFLITAGMARLREARTLYSAAMGVPLATQGALGVEDLQISFQDVHASFEAAIAKAMPIEGADHDAITNSLDERMTAYNTLDHAEIACLSAITHFEVLNEFLTSKQVSHEKQTV